MERRVTTDVATPDIRFDVRGHAGIVILDRPKALNALTLPVIRAMRAKLDQWAVNPAVTHVILTSTSEKAFCAGADVRRLREQIRAADPTLTDFFFEEYQLDRVIHRYPKPYTSLIDGICMGGGMGLSMHAPFRVVSEKAVFAMPESTIGLFPDVGCTRTLAGLPGEIGAYMAVTGGRVNAAEAAAIGLATHFVAGARFPELLAALTLATDPAPVLARFAEAASGATPLLDRRPTIDRIFAGGDVAAILARLEAETGADADWAKHLAAEIRTKSPTSMAVGLKEMRIAARLDLEGTLTLDWRIVCRILQGTDFDEGVRAQLVDRDFRPVWRPASLAEIDPAEIDAHLTTVPARGDIVFPPLG
jgi:enoyl-CoA hydratase